MKKIKSPVLHPTPKGHLDLPQNGNVGDHEVRVVHLQYPQALAYHLGSFVPAVESDRLVI